MDSNLKIFGEQIGWLVLLIHLLNSTARMPFDILLVMLIGANVFPLALGIQCLYENKKTVKCCGSCIQLTQ